MQAERRSARQTSVCSAINGRVSASWSSALLSVRKAFMNGSISHSSDLHISSVRWNTSELLSTCISGRSYSAQPTSATAAKCSRMLSTMSEELWPMRSAAKTNATATPKSTRRAGVSQRRASPCRAYGCRKTSSAASSSAP